MQPGPVVPPMAVGPAADQAVIAAVAELIDHVDQAELSEQATIFATIQQKLTAVLSATGDERG